MIKVCVGLGTEHFNYERLTQAFHLLMAGCDLIAMNKAKYYAHGLPGNIDLAGTRSHFANFFCHVASREKKKKEPSLQILFTHLKQIKLYRWFRRLSFYQGVVYYKLVHFSLRDDFCFSELFLSWCICHGVRI